MKPATLKFGLTWILCLFLFSCTDKVQFFNQYHSVGRSWNDDSIISFDFEIQDTLQAYNIFLQIRANNNYPFNNIYVITSLEDSSDLVKKDTLEYMMADVDGKLLGNGFADMKESKLWYKENYRFSKIGKHTLSVQQAIRKRGEVNAVKSLEGISDIGLSIEKSN